VQKVNEIRILLLYEHFMLLHIPMFSTVNANLMPLKRPLCSTACACARRTLQ